MTSARSIEGRAHTLHRVAGDCAHVEAVVRFLELKALAGAHLTRGIQGPVVR